MQGVYLKYRVHPQGDRECWVMYGDHRIGFAYSVCFETMKMFIPMMILSYISYLSAKEIKKGERNFVSKSIRDFSHVQIVHRNKLILRMFLIVMVVFFICNAPHSIFFMVHTYIVTYHLDKWNSEIGNICHVVLFAFSSMSTIANPIIYARMIREIKTSFESMFKMVPCFRTSSIRRNSISILQKKMAVRVKLTIKSTACIENGENNEIEILMYSDKGDKRSEKK